MALAQRETQTVFSSIWIQVLDSIASNNNLYIKQIFMNNGMDNEPNLEKIFL